MPPHVEQVDVEGMDGSDSKGGKYDTVEHMWQTELAEVDEGTGQNKWYRKGVDYWAAIPATIDGVVRTNTSSGPHLALSVGWLGPSVGL
jgi:hypothetical protein